MPHSIRECLTYLRTHTLEEAARDDQLPPGDRLGGRVAALARGVLGRDAPPIQDEDISALRKIYSSHGLLQEQKDRIFQVCMRVVLHDIRPELKESRAREIALGIDSTVQPYVLIVLDMIPSTDRTEKTLLASVSLFQGIWRRDHLEDILSAVEGIPADQRAAIISAAQSFLEKTNSVWGRLKVLKFIKELHPDHRDDIVRWTLSLMAEADRVQSIPSNTGLPPRDPVGEVLALLGAVRWLPGDQRDAIIRISQPFMEGVKSLTARAEILEAVGALPLDQRSAIIEAARPFFVNISHGVGKASLLRIMQNLPGEVLTGENLTIIASFIETSSYELRHYVISIMILLAPATRMAAINILHRLSQSGIFGQYFFYGENSVLTILFTNDPSLKESAYAYLQNELSTNRDRLSLRALSQKIIDYQAPLQLHGEHPLFQEAINAFILSDPDAANNPKNPYTLHHRLQELVGVPVVLSPFPGPVEGQVFHVTVQPLLEEAENIKKSMTFDQLPREVNANTVKDLFQAIDERMASLSSDEEREAVLRQIQNQNADFYQTLKNELLGPYIAKLLATTGPANERAPVEVMQLFGILKFVLDQSDTLEEGQVLTSREEALLKIAGSIRHCEGGKKEGISLAYQWVKGQYRAVSSHSDEAKAKAYVYSVMDNVLASLLSGDTPLMRTLTGAQTDVGQLSHQAIFLKNLIGKKVGLVWDLTFDQHSHVLYDELIKKTPEEALRIFFHYFSAGVLVKALKDQINRDLSDMNSDDPVKSEKANTFYHLLFALLDEDQSLWETKLDEDGLETGISLKTDGVIKLLTEFGYLQESNTLQILDSMRREAADVVVLRGLSEALAVKDTSLLHALFGRMYWHHVKAGKKQVDHLDYGRAAFLGTDSRIAVAPEERHEVVRQIEIEYVLQSMKSASDMGPLLAEMERIDRDVANRLYGVMYEDLKQAGKLEGYEYFGGGEAAFKKAGELTEEKAAAIDALVPALRAEWLPAEAL